MSEIGNEVGRKIALLEYLRIHPGNISGAAAFLQVARPEIERLIEKYSTEFQALEAEYLDKLQEAVFCAALGKALPEGIDADSFKLNDAIKILERYRPEWSRQNGTKGKGRWQGARSNGYAARRIFNAGTGTGSAGQKPRTFYAPPAAILTENQGSVERPDAVGGADGVDEGTRLGGRDSADSGIIDIPD